jgi:hypothetical protein
LKALKRIDDKGRQKIRIHDQEEFRFKIHRKRKKDQVAKNQLKMLYFHFMLSIAFTDQKKTSFEILIKKKPTITNLVTNPS